MPSILSPTQQALEQVGRLCVTAYDLKPLTQSDGRSKVAGLDRKGIRALSVWAEAKQVHLELEVARVEITKRVAATSLARMASHLSEDVALTCRVENDEVLLAVQLRVRATPLDATRSMGLLQQLKKIDVTAARIQAAARSEISKASPTEELAAILGPVAELPERFLLALDQVSQHFFIELTELVRSGTSVALLGSQPCCRFALASLSHQLKESEDQEPLFELLVSSMQVQALVELLAKLPGSVAVPAPTLASTLQRHDVAEEMDALLSACLQRGRSLLLHGSEAQLEKLLHGGQSLEADPIRPVVLEVPEIELELLLDFTIHTAAATGPMPGTDVLKVAQQLALDALLGVDERDRIRLLDPIARRALGEAADRKSEAADRKSEAAERESEAAERNMGASCRKANRFGQTERLALQLSSHHRTLRDPTSAVSHGSTQNAQRSLHRHLAQELQNGDLAAHLKARLCGQDSAIDALVGRLRFETLAGDETKPLRSLTVGPAGVGKTESLKAIAHWLDVPYLRIDCASFADVYAATSQLLGSARGLVGSDRPGRLQRICQLPAAVLEVADLDHCRDGVRSALGDLFLQLLDEGVAESAQGTSFRTSNLLFGFSMNLPDGKDLALWQPMGFADRGSVEVQIEAEAELSRLISGTLLSRLGQPILYRALGLIDHRKIFLRALERSLKLVSERLGRDAETVEVAPEVAEVALPSDRPRAGTHRRGGREIESIARQMAVDALTEVPGSGLDLARRGETLTVVPAACPREKAL